MMKISAVLGPHLAGGPAQGRALPPHTCLVPAVWEIQKHGSKCKQVFLPYHIFDRPTDMPMLKPIFFAFRVVLYFFALCVMCIISFWFSHSRQNFLIIFRYTKLGIFHLTVHSIIKRVIYVWLKLRSSHSEVLTLINGEISENCLEEMHS